MDKLLEELFNSFGVSSREEDIRNIIKNEVESIKSIGNTSINIQEDTMGNLIIKLGDGGEKFMLCTHMDNPGFMVTNIDNGGFLKTSAIGNIKPEKMLGMLVKFKNNIIGRIDSAKSNPTVEDLFIDLGVSSREAAQKQIKEGDLAELIGNRVESNGRIIGPNLHSKLACHVFVEIIKEIMKINNLNKEVYFVFSTGYHKGFMGARAAASKIKPTAAIVLDAIEAEDYSGGKGDIKLEGGPLITIFDKSLVIHHKVKELIEKSADKLDIRTQYNIGSGKNEGGLIHKEVGGIKTAMLGMPCRYLDTSEEIMALKDIDDMRRLVSEVIKGSLED